MCKRGQSCSPTWMPDNMGDNVFDGPLPDLNVWIKELYRVLKPSTHLYIFTNTISLQETLNVATECGFKLSNIISMIKDTCMPNKWYLKQTELVLFFRKGSAKKINDMTCKDNFKVVMPKKRDGKLHITQKPLDFIEQLVFNSSQEGEVVLDCFAGSSTTLLAAKKLGRKYIGIEKDLKYYEISKERLQ